MKSNSKLKESLLGRIVRTFLFLLHQYVLDPLDLALDYLQGYFDPFVKQGQYLSGNYAPVDTEISAFQLKVSQGEIPEGLSGEFIRNGPNPKSIPRGGHHWFDGDGMLHGVRIAPDGALSYFNRYIKTKALKEETKTGRRLRLRMGELHGKIGLLKAGLNIVKQSIGLAPSVGGSANTALVYHGNKLQALVENDVPYAIKVFNDGRLETTARLELGGINAVTAHPKVDPNTKELFFLWYSWTSKPYITYGFMNPEGEVVLYVILLRTENANELPRTIPIDIPEPIIVHDLAITEHYAIIFDLSLVFRKEKMLVNTGSPFSFDRTHGATIGILDRYARKSRSIKWFTIPPSFLFHSVNAWEEGDEVVIYTCRYSDFVLEGPLDHYSELVEWRLNLNTMRATEHVLFAGTPMEFPIVHPNLIGRKSRYAYFATSTPVDNKIADFNGIVKIKSNITLMDCIYGANKAGGEPVFVPKQDGSQEDDGYLMTFVHDNGRNQSQFWILDAKDVSTVAIVNLPSRVPHGFHGIWVSEEEIRSQSD